MDAQTYQFRFAVAAFGFHDVVRRRRWKAAARELSKAIASGKTAIRVHVDNRCCVGRRDGIEACYSEVAGTNTRFGSCRWLIRSEEHRPADGHGVTNHLFASGRLIAARVYGNQAQIPAARGIQQCGGFSGCALANRTAACCPGILNTVERCIEHCAFHDDRIGPIGGAAR